jgi:hypothetical protein
MKRKQRQTKINENAPCQQGELFRLRVIIWGWLIASVMKNKFKQKLIHAFYFKSYLYNLTKLSWN